MEDLKSPPASATICHAHSVPEGWHLQYSKWKSKSSLLGLMGCLALIGLSFVALLSAPASSTAPFLSPRISTFLGFPHHDEEANPNQYETRIKEVLERAALPNRTVIITALNAAWAAEGTMIDMFIESFWHGEDTRKLLEHLVIVCVDDKAYQRCLVIHPHCLDIKTPGINFSGEQILLSADYIKLMWRRIKFLQTVLEMNYSFIFTDTDVLWFRNPFPLVQSDTEADFQIASDRYNGKPGDVHNYPNAGFIYVRANTRTVRFYEYWYEERKRGSKMADQEVFNAFKFDKEFTSIGMKLRFLDTQFIGGFCALKDTDMTKALTMHATCCKGLEAKLLDLRMMLDGWKKWHAHNQDLVAASSHNQSASQLVELNDPHFKEPYACPRSWHRH